MGSSYFFQTYEDFQIKDYDDLCIMDKFIFPGNVMNMKLKDKDVFMFRNMPKKGFIDDVIESKVYMKLGKFLIPEFNEYIGFTINDLILLRPLFDELDERHSYEKIIADAYIENNEFKLTPEQRLEAYNEYKKKKVAK